MQEKLSKAREIDNPDQRKALYQEVDRKAVEEAIYIDLYQLTEQFGVRDTVKNFNYDSFMKCYFWDAEKQ